MSFHSFADFLAMGGHGLYVWLAYGSTIAVVLGNVLAVRIARRRYFRQAQALERRLRADAGGTHPHLEDQNTDRMKGS